MLDSLAADIKTVLVIQGEKKLFGKSNELHCQILEVLLETISLLRNSNKAHAKLLVLQQRAQLRKAAHTKAKPRNKSDGFLRSLFRKSPKASSTS